MATIRKRGHRYEVQVRRLGHPAQSRTFDTRSDAATWARQIEAAIDRGGLPASRRELAAITLAALLTRYRDTVTPRKRSAYAERARIKIILSQPVAARSLATLRPHHFAEYRDWRLEHVCGETARKDLVLLRRLFEVARREWGVPVERNPLDDVTKPPPSRPRDRRLTDDDRARLAAALTKTRTPLLRFAVELATETAMRRGEMLRAEWRHVDWDRCTLAIPITKTDVPRVVPLTPRAVALLREMAAAAFDPVRILPWRPNALRLAWERLKRRAGVVDLRFHDLRHEAVSRFFELGLSVPEVALISGHRDPRMLFRYANMRAEDVARKLKGAEVVEGAQRSPPGIAAL